MKVDVMDLQGKKSKTVELPVQFSEAYEPNLVKRAVLAFLSRLRQPYGADPRAGFRQSAKLSRRRRDYRGGYGKGISRVPRKIMWRRGLQFGWAGATISGTVGGRRAHPPKADKNWVKDINKKEKSKAIRSALGGLVEEKRLKLVVNDFENLKKTKEIETTLEKLGFAQEFERLEKRKVRAGKGRTRGRKYQNKVGPLVVVGKDCPVVKAAANLRGFDITIVDALNAHLLTRGHEEVRPALFTEDALKIMKEKKLFRSEK